MLPLLTKEEFCRNVENIVVEKNYSYIDAVLKIQEDYGLDYSLISKLISQPLKEKLEKEGMDLNLIKKGKSTLPFA
jgi:uncharacterized protein YdhG (YjbR/CyaY superfamily)